MLIGYDSTTATDVPKGGDFYLGYADGDYANVAKVRAHVGPGVPIKSVTVKGSLDADIADVETGDLDPGSGARWAKNKHARGERPTLYFPSSSRRAVYAALRRVGLRPRKDVDFFIAQYDGVKKIPRWAVAKQCFHGDRGNPGSYSGGHFDTSVARESWLGVHRPTKLSGRSTYLASHLAVRLAKRQNPVSTGKTLLVRLRDELDRILSL